MTSRTTSASPTSPTQILEATRQPRSIQTGCCWALAQPTPPSPSGTWSNQRRLPHNWKATRARSCPWSSQKTGQCKHIYIYKHIYIWLPCFNIILQLVSSFGASVKYLYTRGNGWWVKGRGVRRGSPFSERLGESQCLYIIIILILVESTILRWVLSLVWEYWSVPPQIINRCIYILPLSPTSPNTPLSITHTHVHIKNLWP